MARVSIESLEKRYSPKAAPAVPSLDLQIEEGEFLTLLGPSGCGKTTTLRCVAGLERPTGGRVSIGHEVVDAPAERRHVPPEKRDIGMVFQSYALWPHMSVAANVGYPLRMRKVSVPERARRVRDVLEMVGLDEYASRMATDLSGGQQQRVALARALVADPRLLLFDEPLSNLDARLRQDMRSELRDMHRRVGTTSIYVTHDQEEAVSLSTRIVLLNKGRIEQVGTPREIYWHPVSHFVADFVGYDNFLRATVVTAGDHGVAVRLDGTDLRLDCPARDGLREGDQVEIAMRSASVIMGEPAEAMPNRCTGTVVDIVYLGDEYIYALEMGPQRFSVSLRTAEVANIWPHGAPSRGDTVTAAIPPDSLACLPL
ncbi:ABC transporter ATP-binding protein [Kocuria sp. LUK]|uniref:ABC transporter ATP-binding protein n=1 Tax=Kocuria TaxID=57493 RepID=UPI001E353624|nr:MULTISPECIES: ABC transporter ATP-binding protein [Kocuria]MCD1144220.1 ABC transporter ATP-binding protein [Kocuria sp. LUK]MCJ8504004.1 ABC transporter ATP-binding protein [Kocuria flava]